jgi:hypothetical protein
VAATVRPLRQCRPALALVRRQLVATFSHASTRFAIEAIVLDQTGTLSDSKLRVTDVLAERQTQDTVLSCGWCGRSCGVLDELERGGLANRTTVGTAGQASWRRWNVPDAATHLRQAQDNHTTPPSESGMHLQGPLAPACESWRDDMQWLMRVRAAGPEPVRRLPASSQRWNCPETCRIMPPECRAE